MEIEFEPALEAFAYYVSLGLYLGMYEHPTLIAVCEAHGLTVRFVDAHELAPYVGGRRNGNAFLFRDRKRIWVRKRLSTGSLSLALAHELAHSLLAKYENLSHERLEDYCDGFAQTLVREWIALLDIRPGDPSGLTKPHLAKTRVANWRLQPQQSKPRRKRAT